MLLALTFLEDMEDVLLGNRGSPCDRHAFNSCQTLTWHATITQLASHEYSTGQQQALSTVTAVMSLNVWETPIKWFLSLIYICACMDCGDHVRWPTLPLPLCCWAAGQRLVWCLSQHPNMWQCVHHHPLICEARGTGVISSTELLMTCCAEWSGSNEEEVAWRTSKLKLSDLQHSCRN